MDKNDNMKYNSIGTVFSLQYPETVKKVTSISKKSVKDMYPRMIFEDYDTAIDMRDINDVSKD